MTALTEQGEAYRGHRLRSRDTRRAEEKTAPVPALGQPCSVSAER